MTRPDPTNHQAANRAAFEFKGHPMNRIEEIQARLEAAAPTPWDCDGLAETGHTHLSLFEGNNHGRIIATGITRYEDADLLFNAPADIAHLLAALQDVRNFADLLIGEDGQDDPNYRDAAREAAGRQLHNILNSARVQA